MGRNSSVGVTTRCGLDGPGIESLWGARFSAPVQTGPGAHSASYTMHTGSFPGLKRPGRGVHHPPVSSSSTALLPLCVFVACSRAAFTFYLTLLLACCAPVEAALLPWAMNVLYCLSRSEIFLEVIVKRNRSKVINPCKQMQWNKYDLTATVSVSVWK